MSESMDIDRGVGVGVGGSRTGAQTGSGPPSTAGPPTAIAAAATATSATSATSAAASVTGSSMHPPSHLAQPSSTPSAAMEGVESGGGGGGGGGGSSMPSHTTSVPSAAPPSASSVFPNHASSGVGAGGGGGPGPSSGADGSGVTQEAIDAASNPEKAGHLYLPFSYGSIATSLGKGASDSATHEWTVFVRGLETPDISHVVSKVVFTLHHSFADPIREITEFPFEVTESGWGEFEVAIRIHFHDPTLKALPLTHLLKLYPPGTHTPLLDRPVVSETYDEICFVDTTPAMRAILTTKPQPTTKKSPHEPYFTEFSEAADLEAIARAQILVDGEMASYRQRLARAEQERAQLELQIASLGGSAE